MPMVTPCYDIVDNVNMEALYKKTGNPLYCWYIILNNINYERDIPPFALEYLKDVARGLVTFDPNDAEGTRAMGEEVLQNILHLTKKQYNDMERRAENRKKFSEFKDQMYKQAKDGKPIKKTALSRVYQTKDDITLENKRRDIAKAQKEIDAVSNLRKTKVEELGIEFLCAHETMEQHSRDMWTQKQRIYEEKDYPLAGKKKGYCGKCSLHGTACYKGIVKRSIDAAHVLLGIEP